MMKMLNEKVYYGSGFMCLRIVEGMLDTTAAQLNHFAARRRVKPGDTAPLF